MVGHSRRMPTLPVFLELKGCPCLVVGGGPVAFRKARALAACGARVKVVSPSVTAGFRRLVRRGRLEWRARPFRCGDLKGMRLVVAAAGNEAVNEQAAREARARGIWINVVDRPRLCSFVFPAVVRRGGLVVAVSTGGASPALARWIRRDLERRYGLQFQALVAKASRLRPRVQRAVPDAARRKRLLERALKAYFKVLNAEIRPAATGG